jgi:hypothetical protein
MLVNSSNYLTLFAFLQDAGIGTSIDSFYEYLLKVSSWSLVWW